MTLMDGVGKDFKDDYIGEFTLEEVWDAAKAAFPAKDGYVYNAYFNCATAAGMIAKLPRHSNKLDARIVINLICMMGQYETMKMLNFPSFEKAILAFLNDKEQAKYKAQITDKYQLIYEYKLLVRSSYTLTSNTWTPHVPSCLVMLSVSFRQFHSCVACVDCSIVWCGVVPFRVCSV